MVGVGLLAAGCTDQDTDPDGRPAARRTVRSDELDPDVATAIGALTQIRAVSALVDDSSRRFPAEARSLRSVRRVLAAHADRLAAAVPEGVEVPERALPPAAARRRVRPSVARRVRDLQGELVERAMAAESGAFAQLLGSMSAALAQQLVLWGDDEP